METWRPPDSRNTIRKYASDSCTLILYCSTLFETLCIPFPQMLHSTRVKASFLPSSIRCARNCYDITYVVTYVSRAEVFTYVHMCHTKHGNRCELYTNYGEAFAWGG
eukprot:2179053-Pyramimonas_sp.AAC.1